MASIDDDPETNSAPSLDLDNDDSTTGGNNYSTTYQIGVSGPVGVVDSDVSIADADGDMIEVATILLNSNNNKDVLAVDEALVPDGISISSTTSSVSFSGSASPADYETALKAVTFDTSDDASELTRSITITVNDGSSDSGTAFSTIVVTL